MQVYLQLFWTFFKIGAFTFGGGYAMIPLIEREIVLKKGWIHEEDIVDIFAVAQTIPGAIAINSATFVGFKVKRYWGAVWSTLGIILPSFIIITLIAAVFVQFQDLPAVKAAFGAIRATVVAMIILAAIKVGKASIKDWVGYAIAGAAVVLLLALDVHAIIIIVCGAFAGLLLYPRTGMGRDQKK